MNTGPGLSPLAVLTMNTGPGLSPLAVLTMNTGPGLSPLDVLTMGLQCQLAFRNHPPPPLPEPM